MRLPWKRAGRSIPVRSSAWVRGRKARIACHPPWCYGCSHEAAAIPSPWGLDARHSRIDRCRHPVVQRANEARRSTLDEVAEPKQRGPRPRKAV